MIPEGWRQEIADALFTKITKGTTPPKTEIVEKAGVPFLRVNNLGIGVGSKIQDKIILVSKQCHETLLARSKCFPGDILINIVGPPLGQSILLNSDFNSYNINQAILLFRPDCKIMDREYAYFYINSSVAQNWLESRSKKTSGQQNLTIETCKALPICLPSVIEQRKIAQVLSTWDRAIETVEALVTNARAQKKALMQVLLTGKSRLPGFDRPWENATIGAVADEVSERAGDAAELPVLSCSKYDGMVMSLTYFKKKVYSDDTSNYKVMRHGNFGFPSNHIEEGSIGYQDICEAGIVSPIYCVFRSNGAVDDGYLYKLLKTDRYRQIFAAATNASVDRRGSLRWREFAKIQIPLPSIEEQAAISGAINAADRSERTYVDQHAALRREKSALMQQLLTGKRRVKDGAVT